MLCIAIASTRAEAEAGPPVALPRSCVALPFAFACMVKGRRSLQGSCHGVHPCRLVRSARVRVLCARATPQHQHESRETSFPLVYVASLPLVGWEGLERTLRHAYPDRLALHSMIVVEEDNAYSVFDFLPRQPKDPVTALTLLTGGSVEGLLRERLVSSLPARRCQVLGTAKHKQVCQLSALLVAVGASTQVAFSCV